MNTTTNIKCKLVVLGDERTGKSAFVSNLIDEMVLDQYQVSRHCFQADLRKLIL